MRKYTGLVLASLMLACSGGGDSGNGGSSGATNGFVVANCRIPADEIQDGGPGRDGIPAILEPEYRTLSTLNLNELPLGELDLIMVVEIDGVVRGYPEMALWTHEVVNDRLNQRDIVVSYCPLTGSGTVFDRDPNEFFFVSGLLYETNLIMFDDRTESLWPQMELESSCGQRAREAMNLYPVREMTVEMARLIDPDMQIVIGGRQRGGNPTGNYPYGTYDRLDNDTLLFPVSEVDTTFPIKSLTLAVWVDGVWKGYPHQAFTSDIAVNETVNDQPIVVFYASLGRFAHAYSRVVGDQTLTFDLIPAEINGNFYLRDRETETTWDLMGRAFEGPLEGERLTQMLNFNAMWFSFKVSFPDAEVYGL